MFQKVVAHGNARLFVKRLRKRIESRHMQPLEPGHETFGQEHRSKVRWRGGAAFR